MWRIPIIIGRKLCHLRVKIKDAHVAYPDNYREEAVPFESKNKRCACGVIGSRARLRIWCRKAWGFESLHAHILENEAVGREVHPEGMILTVTGIYCFFGRSLHESNM